MTAPERLDLDAAAKAIDAAFMLYDGEPIEVATEFGLQAIAELRAEREAHERLKKALRDGLDQIEEDGEIGSGVREVICAALAAEGKPCSAE